MASEKTNTSTQTENKNESIKEKFRRFKEEEMPEGSIEKLQEEREELKSFINKIHSHPTFKKARIILIITTVIIFYFTSFNITLVFLPFGLAALYIGVPWGIKAPKQAKFRKAFKEDLVSIIIPHFGKELSYEPFSGIDKEKVNNSLIFPLKAKDLHAEDHISGEVNETKIEISEIILQNNPAKEMKGVYFSKKQKEEGEFTKKYVMKRQVALMNSPFIGLCFIADFNKHFKGTTVLRPLDYKWRVTKVRKGKEQRASYNPSSRITDQDESIKLGEVKLEDPDFENLYKIYSNDQVAARYIFSTSMMERIKAFQEKWDEKIFMSFKDSKLYLSIPFSNGLFEPDIQSSEPVEKQLEHIFYDLENIFGIVEELKLNQRIWGKA